MSQQHLGEAYGGSVPENYERYFVPAIGAPLAGVVGQVNDELRGSLERDVVAKWQEFVSNRNLMLQVRVVVATARK